MIAASRRSFITGLVALVAAPAIVRAGSLMPVNSKLIFDSQLEINRITSEAVRLFQDSNEFLGSLPEYEHGAGAFALDVLYGSVKPRPEWASWVDDKQWSSEECRTMMERQIPYESVFEAGDAEIGRTLRIRLPNDYIMSDGPGLRSDGLLRYNKARRSIDVIPQIPDSLALAAVAVAIAPVVLAKPVTRRFWGR